ncbi:uncharacterized protein RHOBADRAFT_55320, partial [Rhodotorula graminis WP1]
VCRPSTSRPRASIRPDGARPSPDGPRRLARVGPRRRGGSDARRVGRRPVRPATAARGDAVDLAERDPRRGAGEVGRGEPEGIPAPEVAVRLHGQDDDGRRDVRGEGLCRAAQAVRELVGASSVTERRRRTTSRAVIYRATDD